MKRKIKYIIAGFFNHITGFTHFLESESEKRAYLILKKYARVKKQVRIGAYRVDFLDAKTKKIIEIDGVHHDSRKEYDKRSDAFLASKGYSVTRIPAHIFYTKDAEKTVQKIFRK